MKAGVQSVYLTYDPCPRNSPEAVCGKPVVNGIIEACATTSSTSTSPIAIKDCARVSFTLSPDSVAATGIYNAAIAAWKRAKGY